MTIEWGILPHNFGGTAYDIETLKVLNFWDEGTLSNIADEAEMEEACLAIIKTVFGLRAIDCVSAEPYTDAFDEWGDELVPGLLEGTRVNTDIKNLPHYFMHIKIKDNEDILCFFTWENCPHIYMQTHKPRKCQFLEYLTDLQRKDKTELTFKVKVSTTLTDISDEQFKTLIENTRLAVEALLEEDLEHIIYDCYQNETDCGYGLWGEDEFTMEIEEITSEIHHDTGR